MNGLPFMRDAGKKLFEIWHSCGDGVRKGPRFRAASDARRYVRGFAGPGTISVRCPDGSFSSLVSDAPIVESKREDRRFEARARESVGVTWAPYGHATAVCGVKNVGSGGLRLAMTRCEGSIHRGTHVHIRLPTSAQCWMAGIVAWKNDSEVGVALGPLDEAERLMFDVWLDGLVPLYMSR